MTDEKPPVVDKPAKPAQTFKSERPGFFRGARIFRNPASRNPKPEDPKHGNPS